MREGGKPRACVLGAALLASLACWPASAADRAAFDAPRRALEPGMRELTFADGSTYRGSVVNGVAHGRGEYVSPAFRYDGEWREGRKEGEGAYLWANGDRYEGRFAQDHPDGHGTFRFANGDTYEGDVKSGVIEGRGVYIARDGDTFTGPFRD